MARKIILFPNYFISKEIQQYNNIEVEVKGIWEWHISCNISKWF